MQIKPPADGKIVQRFNFDGHRWALYERALQDGASFLWVPLRLIAEDVGGRKTWKERRSYWLGWSTDEQRFQFRRDTSDLREKRPELYAAVEAYMKANYPRDWPEDFASPEEIEAERRAERERGAKYKKAAKVEEVDPFS
jgi:hypothetical protein